MWPRCGVEDGLSPRLRLQRFEQGAQFGAGRFHVRRVVEKLAVELEVHRAGQGKRLIAQGGKKVFRLRLSGALKAEKVVAAGGNARQGRVLGVFRKALVGVAAALRGLDVGKAHALRRERFPVDVALIVGDVHAPNGEVRARGCVEADGAAQHQRREERRKQAQRPEGDEKAADAAAGGRTPLPGPVSRPWVSPPWAASARPRGRRRPARPSGIAGAPLPPRRFGGGRRGGRS